MATCFHLAHMSFCKKITRRWLATTGQAPLPEIPENNSWELDDNIEYLILWFEGTITTPNIVVVDLLEDEGWLKIPLNCSHRFLSLFFFLVTFLCIWLLEA